MPELPAFEPAAPGQAPPDRAEVVVMLASFGERTPDQVPESIGSMELAWLVHQVEQRYGVPLDLDDTDLARMSTVASAVDVIREHLTHG